MFHAPQPAAGHNRSSSSKKEKKTKIPVSIFAVRTGICAILLGRWTVVVAQLKNMAFPDPE